VRASPESQPERLTPQRILLLAAAFLPVLALLAWQGWRTYWLCDDAFISFRYVRNFVEGHGLVFNPGERVEGYTNFLWVLELAALWKMLGVAPEAGCTILSALYTAGSIALTAVLALASPFRDRRVFVAWGALLLLAASHTWAVWATSGLETRQFTFFVLLAAVCLHLSADRPGLLVLASLAIAAGEYTRPEGTLLFGCCFAWLVFDRLRRRSLRLREIARFALPFLVLVGAHYAWRASYYGELWPNTYYAKHIRAWPEAGYRYFAAAGVELGLFLLVPAAVAGAVARLRRGDAVHLLGIAILLPHVAYLVRIGGDHFEYRVLDFYWPFLAVAGVEGILAAARALPWIGSRAPARDFAATAMLLVLLAYTSAVQVAKDLATARLDTRGQTQKMLVKLPREEFGALYLLPGMPPLLGWYDSVNVYLAKHGVAAPYAEHKFFWKQELEDYQPYGVLHGAGMLPADAVTSRGSIGISGYYLADLELIDAKGLTDRHVARLPVTRPNDQRYMAHDRSADWPYLEGRGFNLLVQPAARSAEEALFAANYAMKIRDDLWMPFETLSPTWADRAFLAGPEVLRWEGAATLGCFGEGDPAGWTLAGDSFAGDPSRETFRRRRLHAVHRCPVGWILDSRAGDAALPATGRAVSPSFRVLPGSSLELWLGGSGPGAGVRLLKDGQVLAEWSSRDPVGISPERHDLSAWVGQELQVEAFDDSAEAGGYVLLGDVVLVVPGKLGGS